MLATGGRWCRPSFNIACRHAQQASSAQAFRNNFSNNFSSASSTESDDNGPNDLKHNVNSDTAKNAGGQTEGNPGGGVSANTPPGPYSTVEIDPENKTVMTTVGELPISPFMDPSFHDARTRYTKPKPTKTQYKLTKFQRRLRRCPYALALATPIRRSPACTTAVPRFFLERFNLLAHPETGEPWMVPVGLNSKVPKRETPEPADPADSAWEAALEESSREAEPDVRKGRAAGDELDPAVEDELDVDENAVPEEGSAVNHQPAPSDDAPLPKQSTPKEDNPPPNEPATPPKATAPKKPPPTHPSGTPKGVKTGASSYVLSRQTLLREFNNPASEYVRLEKRLFRMSDHGLARLSSALNSAVWRSDMDSVLLELMRRRVVEGLCHFAGMVGGEGRKYVARLGRVEEVAGLKHKGCLLYVGPVVVGEEAQEGEQYVPPRLSTMDIEGDRFTNVIVVHNLPEILGAEHLARLKEGCEMMRGGGWFHLGRLATVQLQLMIWRLQGYMAWDQPAGIEGAAGIPSEDGAAGVPETDWAAGLGEAEGPASPASSEEAAPSSPKLATPSSE